MALGLQGQFMKRFQAQGIPGMAIQCGAWAARNLGDGADSDGKKSSSPADRR